MIPLALLLTAACKPKLPCGPEFSTQCRKISGLGCYEPQAPLSGGTLQQVLDTLGAQYDRFLNDIEDFDSNQCLHNDVFECSSYTVVATGQGGDGLGVAVFDTQSGIYVAGHSYAASIDGPTPECERRFFGDEAAIPCIKEAVSWINSTKESCDPLAIEPCDFSVCAPYLSGQLQWVQIPASPVAVIPIKRPF